MRKSRFSEEQIIQIIREYEAGAQVAELCRRPGGLLAHAHLRPQGAAVAGFRAGVMPGAGA